MKKQIVLSCLAFFMAMAAMAQQPNPQWVTIKSANLKCWECREQLDKYLLLEKGNSEGAIQQWKINLLQGEIRVQFLPNMTNADNIRTVLNNAGFDADTTKATEEAYKKLPPSCKRAEEGGGPQKGKPCHVKPYE
jgi:hypothetical protein